MGRKVMTLFSYAGSHGLKKGQDYYGQKSDDFVLSCRLPWPEERPRFLSSEM